MPGGEVFRRNVIEIFPAIEAGLDGKGVRFCMMLDLPDQLMNRKPYLLFGLEQDCAAEGIRAFQPVPFVINADDVRMIVLSAASGVRSSTTPTPVE